MVYVVHIPHRSIRSLSPESLKAISRAAHEVFPNTRLKLISSEDSPILDEQAISGYTWADEDGQSHLQYGYHAAPKFLKAQIARVCDPSRMPTFDSRTLFLDIETHNAEKRWDMPLHDFFRLGQYAWGEGEVHTTTNVQEIVDAIYRADTVWAHNGHSFDFSVLLNGNALDLTMSGVLKDTYPWAEYRFPCPEQYRHVSGQFLKGQTVPSQYRKWLSLDNLSYQFGFKGKATHLDKLAAKYNPPGTRKSDLDFGLIPVDDPEFLEYAEHDIVGLRELVRSMTYASPWEDYDDRVQQRCAVNAHMTRNGVLVDMAFTKKRISDLAKAKADTLEWMHEEFGYPTTGAMPWRTNAGKKALFDLLASYGITPESRKDWVKTKTGNPSLSGDALKAVAEGTDAEEIVERIAEMTGQRTLAEQIQDYTHLDGKVHPDIDELQRSGRSSVTKPGLTTFGSRKNTTDKAMLIPNPGYLMFSADLSNGDARAVAAMSGDKKRAEWFLPGADSHEIVGRLVWGDLVYDSNPKHYRQLAKVLNHASAYGCGARKLAKTAGVELSVAQKFLDVIHRVYVDVKAWQDRVRQEGSSTGYVVNPWGRECPVEPERSYTQSPALLGQSCTSEVLYDGLIRLYRVNREMMDHILFPVHDEIIFEAPDGNTQWAKDLVGCVTCVVNGIEFTMEHGEGAKNWQESTH